MAEATIQVQVCHALPDSSLLRSLRVPAGTTIEQAVALSGLLQDVPGLDLAINMVGIYGKKKPLDTVLREHDRVEVYRPLQADPKEARRRRAGNKPAKA
ncbi:RnfH family protein [Janthinobacterium sp. 1_2014MBL_MicDiv]|uniref:RnfH family protein n=1 Tax=Janthinobacterium sp. 1_2014MBL_MicDiv TaxID=1644131 RepID=UPI0008F53DA4|nr:RnfH family protein [Janthinobacterium sp. 1_2014MBL_MicDiv]APA68821.1 protein RnfH [Janthinobacterium sp. 1_2014MBL_MicDiv]